VVTPGTEVSEIVALGRGSGAITERGTEVPVDVRVWARRISLTVGDPHGIDVGAAGNVSEPDQMSITAGDVAMVGVAQAALGEPAAAVRRPGGIRVELGCAEPRPGRPGEAPVRRRLGMIDAIVDVMLLDPVLGGLGDGGSILAGGGGRLCVRG